MAFARSDASDTRARWSCSQAMQGFDDRPTSFLPHVPSMFGRMAPDLGLDRVERGMRASTSAASGDLVETWNWKNAAAHVRPAKCQAHRRVGAISGQSFEIRHSRRPAARP